MQFWWQTASIRSSASTFSSSISSLLRYRTRMAGNGMRHLGLFFFPLSFQLSQNQAQTIPLLPFVIFYQVDMGEFSKVSNLHGRRSVWQTSPGLFSSLYGNHTYDTVLEKCCGNHVSLAVHDHSPCHFLMYLLQLLGFSHSLSVFFIHIMLSYLVSDLCVFTFRNMHIM